MTTRIGCWQLATAGHCRFEAGRPHQHQGSFARQAAYNGIDALVMETAHAIRPRNGCEIDGYRRPRCRPVLRGPGSRNREVRQRRPNRRREAPSGFPHFPGPARVRQDIPGRPLGGDPRRGRSFRDLRGRGFGRRERPVEADRAGGPCERVRDRPGGSGHRGNGRGSSGCANPHGRDPRFRGEVHGARNPSRAASGRGPRQGPTGRRLVARIAHDGGGRAVRRDADGSTPYGGPRDSHIRPVTVVWQGHNGDGQDVQTGVRRLDPEDARPSERETRRVRMARPHESRSRP